MPLGEGEHVRVGPGVGPRDGGEESELELRIVTSELELGDSAIGANDCEEGGSKVRSSLCGVCGNNGPTACPPLA